jgi:hypothetical protein
MLTHGSKNFVFNFVGVRQGHAAVKSQTVRAVLISVCCGHVILLWTSHRYAPAPIKWQRAWSRLDHIAKTLYPPLAFYRPKIAF